MNILSITNIKKNMIKKARGGQSVVELLITVALIGLTVPVLAEGFVMSRSSTVQREVRQDALMLMKESLDAIRTLREKGWAEILNGTYHPILLGNNWTLESDNEHIGNFVRQLVISDVQRNSSGSIVESGGTVDPSTKKVTHLISWQEPTADSIEYVTYITRYLANAIKKHTTTADFSGGTFTNTETAAVGDGAVRLISPATSYSFIDDYTTSTDYTFDSNKIEVTGGFAQLKQIITSVSGSTANSDFTSNSTGWTYRSYGTVASSGSYLSTGGNPGGYIRVDHPVSSKKLSGGYYEQAFTTTTANLNGNLAFQWKVVAYSASPDSYTLYAWVDTYSGGTPATVVWNSGNRTAVTSWSSTVNVNITPYITAARTYYIKVGSYVDYPTTNKGPFQTGYDNVLVSWSGSSSSFASDSPPINRNNSFSAYRIDGYTSFAETSVLNGGSIGYQLSYDNGSSWYYYAGAPIKNWVTASSSANVNDAATVNTNIPTFPTTNNQINVKAYLTGNGTQQVKLDTVTIGYNGLYQVNTGNYISPSMDAGSNVSFNSINWTEYDTSNTTVQLQIATNTDNSTWSFLGPDGTASTYFTGQTGQLPLGLTSGRYLKFKVYFESVTTDQPNVQEYYVNYSP